MFCEYFQANVQKEKTWFLSACMRNEENVAFARCLDKKTGIFEFFVPKDQEEIFLETMARIEKMGIVSNLVKKENRLRRLLNNQLS